MRPVDGDGIERPTLSVTLRTYDERSVVDWSPLVAIARAADEVGIDRIVVSDHVVLGEHLEEHEEHGGGTFPTGSDGAWLEPMTVLALLAGVTTNVRLATGVLITPLRRPVVLAKTAATLDVLSGGRLDLGVGIGWQREEYEAAGLDFGARGKLLDEALAVCRTLWRDRPASYSSERLEFARIWCEPKPVRADGPPIWVSGTLAPAVVARIAKYGDGWIPWAEHRKDIRWALDELRAALAAHGRDASELDVRHDLALITTGDRTDLDATFRPVPALVDAGVTDFRVLFRPAGDIAAATAELRALVEAFRSTVGRSAP